MPDSDIDPFASAADQARMVRDGEVSATDLAAAYLDRIAERDDDLNAYVTVTDDLARESAADADRAVDAGADLGPLHGVPIALKDLRDMKAGVRHTFGSKLVADMGFVAEDTSVAVERLEAAGATVLGKTNVPEFGHKGVTQNDVVGATASPLAPEKNAGGSSGGSAAAVAAGLAAAATGSDSGGSIRIPAAACGVFGHKPSYGLIPIDDRPNAFGKTTHHSVQGPLTRTVEDAALLLDVMSGFHPRDPASVPVDIDFREAVERSIEDFRIGYSPDLEAFPVEDEVAAVVEDALGAFEAAGATVEAVTVDHGLSMTDLADAIETTFATTVLGTVETLEASYGVDLREFPDQVSDSLLDLLDVADGTDLADVAATGIPRTEVFDATEDVLDEYDLLVTPTVGTTGMDLHTDRGTDWELALTWPFNWTGHPAASVPAGLTDDGLPVGMQVVGPRYGDDAVLAASAAVERERPWQDAYPR